MKCPNCGTEINNDTNFCPICGYDTTPAVYLCPHCNNQIIGVENFCPSCGKLLQPPAVGAHTFNSPLHTNFEPQKQSNGFSIAGFVLAFLEPFLGLIFSILGLSTSYQLNKGKGLSIAGMVLSIIFIILHL